VPKRTVAQRPGVAGPEATAAAAAPPPPWSPVELPWVSVGPAAAEFGAASAAEATAASVPAASSRKRSTTPS
jgi:hypothetical protein